MFPTPTPVTADVARFEYKYRLDISTYFRVLNSLRGMADHDRYSLSGHHNRYFVRSLYFDTFDYEAYTDKVFGLCYRKKLRIRTYWAAATQASFVKFEIKAKQGNLTSKHHEIVSLDDSRHFLAHRKWHAEPDPVCIEFQRQLLLKNLRPKLLVDYEREALVPREGGELRITFDHNVRFAAATDLFPERANFTKAMPQAVIMEVKTGQDSPVWIHDIVRRHELTSLPNSKYQWAVERTQAAVINRAY